MRMRLLAGGFAVGALVLAGCGQAPVSGTPNAVFDDTQSLVRAAQDSTATVKSAKFSMNMDMGPFTMTGHGEGRYSPSDYALSMSMEMDMSAAGMGTMTFEQRVVDEVIYLKLPKDTPGFESPSGKPWMRLSLRDAANLGQFDLDKMLEQGDPAKTLEVLAESGKIVATQTGQEIEGQQSTKYTIEVDFAKMMDQYGTVGGTALSELTPGVEFGTVPVDLWVDARNLPLRFDMDMTETFKKALENSGEQVPAEVSQMFDKIVMSARYYDWGTPVTVQAPPADQIGEFTMGG